MSPHHKGLYMDLLAAQYQIGHLSLEQIKNVLGNNFSAWQILKSKFAQDANKNFFNERLATEVRKRKQYSQSRSQNRKKTHDSSYDKHMIEHMKNTPEIETLSKQKEVDLKKEKGKKEREKEREKSENSPPQSPNKEDVLRVFLQQGGKSEMAEAFFNAYEAVDWHYRGSPIKNFASLIPNFIKNWNQNESRNITKSNGASKSSGPAAGAINFINRVKEKFEQ